MDKDRLLQEFLRLSCIKDMQALHTYLDFCINKNMMKKIPGQTSSHHILPRAKTLPFGEFADLVKCPWNKSELTYADHYFAHYLLILAVDHIAVLHSFVAMHTKDIKQGRIQVVDLIDPTSYHQIYQERNKKISDRRKELIDVDGCIMSRAAWCNKTRKLSAEASVAQSTRMSGKNNIVHKSGVVEKIRLTKQTKVVDGKNMDEIGAERAAATMKKELITESGEKTTIYKQAANKHSQTLNKSFLNDLGEETTLAKEYGKQRSVVRRQAGRYYLLQSVFDPTMQQTLCAFDIRALSPGLESCTRENYLGKSKYGRNILTKRGKAHLIGLFVEKLE